jgi:hypothetical protein
LPTAEVSPIETPNSRLGTGQRNVSSPDVGVSPRLAKATPSEADSASRQSSGPPPKSDLLLPEAIATSLDTPKQSPQSPRTLTRFLLLIPHSRADPDFHSGMSNGRISASSNSQPSLRNPTAGPVLPCHPQSTRYSLPALQSMCRPTQSSTPPSHIVNTCSRHSRLLRSQQQSEASGASPPTLECSGIAESINIIEAGIHHSVPIPLLTL